MYNNNIINKDTKDEDVMNLKEDFIEGLKLDSVRAAICTIAVIGLLLTSICLFYSLH